MDEKNAIELLSRVIDAAVQKGLFASAQDVVTTANALHLVASKIKGHGLQISDKSTARDPEQ